MKDNEIIEAYKCCYLSSPCDKCPLYDVENKMCTQHDDILTIEVFKLLTRQQAEIERLQKENEILSTNAIMLFKKGLMRAEKLFQKEVATALHDEAVEDFTHFLIDKAENGAIEVCDLPDLVLE